MKRIAIGQILQETNTLNPRLTQRTDFDVYGVAYGTDIVESYGDVGELAGFVTLPEVQGEDIEWVGLVRAVAWSGGPLDAGLLDTLVNETVAPLHNTSVDGVLLSLHGAESAVDDGDVAGRVLEATRRAVGPDVPVVATLDLHANITRRMVRHADVLVGYHTFPHTDHVSCGQRAARALAHLLDGGTRPRLSVWKIPMVVSSDGRTTDRGIQVDLWQRIVTSEAREDVLSSGLFMVQPWFDVPELGWTLYQAHLGDAPPLDPMAVARACWDTRFYKGTPFLSPEELAPAALEITGKPVAVSESHDATNSGAPGDSTLLLAELVRHDIPDGGALTFCVDPDAVARCLEAGQGTAVDLCVGGGHDPYSEPLALRAQILDLGRLSFHLSGHGGHNLPVDMGRMAVVRAGSATVVLVEKTGPGSSPLLYHAAGLDPRDFKIVIAKSPEGFRADYEPFSAGILYCGAPGCATPFLDTVNFKQVTRPIFPVDTIDEMGTATWAGEMGK